MGFSPLDEPLAIREAQWSERIAALSVWLDGPVSGELAADIFQQVTGLRLPQPSVWRCAERWGNPRQALEHQRQAAANALPRRGQVGPDTLRLPQNRGVSMDGTMT